MSKPRTPSRILSSELYALFGIEEGTRVDLVQIHQKLVEYIRKNNLSPDRRIIQPDEPLKALLKDPSRPLTHFSLLPQVSHHWANPAQC